ncbi:MAG: hypothetical protein H0X02_01895 [Nitrosomonas sp.]|nr:hypothetical protein [Nitrosomonas sp.]
MSEPKKFQIIKATNYAQEIEMIINKEIIEKLEPCKDRFDNFVNNNPDFDGDLQAFISLDNITYDDKVWVVTRLFTKEQNVKWSLLCASSVLSNFESVCPDDKRPRLALDAVQNYLDNPCEETKAAESAWSAEAAARSARLSAEPADPAARLEQEGINLMFMIDAEKLEKLKLKKNTAKIFKKRAG